LIPLVGRVLPGAKILVGPTPELDEAFKTLRERIAVEGDEHEPATCLTADNNPQALASFFDAAAELYDRAPWTIVPDEESLLRITSSKLGIRGAVVCIIGQMKESYGLLLFSSLDDYRRYRRLAGLAMSGSKPSRGFPRHAALSFERTKDVASAQRKEIAAHKWRVAGPAAFPRIMLVEPDMVLRPPARTDYRRMEGVCRAISQLIDTEAELSKVLEGGGSMRRRVTVDVEGAPVSVTISVR
jgi:hypothetical protein